MKQYLQMYCSYLQNDWEKWLSLVKFIMNNTMNESTDVISFYVTYRQNSQIEFESQTEINEHSFMIKQLQQIDMNNFADQMNKLTDSLQNEMLYAQTLQEYHANKKQMSAYDFKSENKIYLSTQNLKTQWLMKKLDWKFTKWLMIRQKMSLYTYELELSSEMKVHSMFHISLLQFSKDNLISKQVLLPQFMIVENEKNSYFVDLIDDMKWNTKFTWFELLIKWKEYKQRTWKSYTTIKKNTLILIKKFHQDYSSQSVLIEWVKKENQQLLSKTQIMKTAR